MISLSENGEGYRDSKTPPTSSQCFKPNKLRQIVQVQQSHCCGKWCHWRTMNPLGKIPLFILLISLLEVRCGPVPALNLNRAAIPETVMYYLADDSLRRILLYDIEHRKQLWRFLTYMLLHTDEVHLGLNVVIQGFLGTPLELEQGRLRCAVIYFGGGLAGALGTSAFAAFSFMAGASGGVYALLTAQIPNVVLNYGTIKYAAHRIATVTTLSAADVAYIFFRVYFYNNERPKIGWVAHASGAVAGVLLGFLVFQGTSKWKKKFRTASCAMLALPLLFTILLSFVRSSPKLLS